MAAEPASRIVKCPACGKDVPWKPESKWRPFCSERCRNVNLGAWATESYRVAASAPPDPTAE